VRPFDNLRELRVRSHDGRALPLQVDGDYIGEAPEAVFSVEPLRLAVVS
jgi:diacylglycerol kinase family enzyme